MSEQAKGFERVEPPDTFGRRKYFTPFKSDEITKSNVADIVHTYFEAFSAEIPSIMFLHNYFKGKQPILGKERDDLANSNCKIVINLARTASKNIKAAFIGEETQYLPIESNDETADKMQKDALKALLTYYRQIEEPAHNSRIEGDRGKYGYAYEFVKRQANGKIKVKRLLPFKTSVVFSEDDEDEMIFAYNFYDRLDESGKPIGKKFTVYTAFKTFVYDTDSGGNLEGNVAESDNPTGIIPVVMYPNNDELMGDFEPAIPILDAINQTYSNRIDNIDDIVEAFLVFVNTEIYDQKVDDKGNITYDNAKLIAMKKNKAIEIRGEAGLPADVKHVVNKLDQNNIQVVCDNLVRLAYVVMGVPDGVNSKSNGGSDSAEADNTREGFKQFEQLLNDKERFFKKSLKQRISIIKALCKADEKSMLGKVVVENLDIRFIRSKSLNNQSDAQIIQILRSTGLFAPDTVIALSNLCESPQEEIDKIMATYKKMKEEGTITDKQYKMLVVSFFMPNADLTALFSEEQKTETVQTSKGVTKNAEGNRV